MCRAGWSILARDKEINQHGPSAGENPSIKETCIGTHTRPQHSDRYARHQIADPVHGSEHSESRPAHFWRKEFGGHRFLKRSLHRAMYARESKQNDEDRNSWRLENEACVGNRSGEISESQEIPFADTVAE